MMTLSARLVTEDLLVSFQTAGEASEQDVTALLKLFETIPRERTVRAFAVSGGTVSTAQRQRIVTNLKGRKIHAAVIASSALARGVVTAIGWFVGGLKSFSDNEIEQAHAYLNLTANEIRLVEDALREIRAAATVSATG